LGDLMLQIYNCFSEKLFAIIVPEQGGGGTTASPSSRKAHRSFASGYSAIASASFSGFFTCSGTHLGLPDNKI